MPTFKEIYSTPRAMFECEEEKFKRKIKTFFSHILFKLEENKGGRKIRMKNNKLKLLFTFSPNWRENW